MRTSGLPRAIVRFSNVYGSRQRAGLEGGVVAVFADALRGGQPVTIHGDGEQTRDLVHVADAVSGTIAAATADRDGIWNVSTGVSTSINALLRLMEARVGVVASVRHGPRRAGDVRSSTLSPARIARQLGWSPSYSLAAGLVELLPRPGSA